MENQQVSGHPLYALAFTLLSIVSGIYASIIANVELYVRMGAGLVAVVSGIMAIRYYHFATKEKIKSLKS